MKSPSGVADDPHRDKLIQVHMEENEVLREQMNEIVKNRLKATTLRKQK